MATTKTYKPLTPGQVKQLQQQSCIAEDWAKILVADGFDASCVINVSFGGAAKIGSTAGKVKSAGGIDKPAGIYNASLFDCTIGDNCRIAGVAVHISGYDIGDNVCIEDVGTIQANAGATFGNGVEIDVLNEAGGREVMLFNELSSQFAYIMCLHRYRPALIRKLKSIASDYAAKVKSGRGRIEGGARIVSCSRIIDVNIGPSARIIGAASLVNGTILSHPDAPTTVGSGVLAHDFIIAESSQVDGGAVLSRCYIGQGCQVGKQYSAENSLFFANSEAFHGEGCSVFGGPYTVSHHKSSLLIAGLFSFYNAGSGTNQSNHMYKLGPCHEGKLERGCKTGSFSYMMWPCKLGPFAVVLGKHTSTFDTSEFPFSHHEARSDGKCMMIPGLHLTTVGTVRDGAKWPSRDRRKCPDKRDIISFAVFSPYTVGKMVRANDILRQMQNSTDKDVEEVSVGGAIVRRPILRTGQKFYKIGIEMYLLEKVVERIESAIAAGGFSPKKAFAVSPAALYSQQWVDICGQLMPHGRLVEFEDAIEKGDIASVEQFSSRLRKIHSFYNDDEWAWVVQTYRDYFGVDLCSAGTDRIISTVSEYTKVRGKFLNLVIADAEKEFDEQSRSGFGQDGGAEDRAADFEQVRGRYETNKFVKEMKASVDALAGRFEKIKAVLEKL